MRIKKIVTKELRSYHPYAEPYQTDQYYAGLANKLQNDLQPLALEMGTEATRRAAILLTLYMEDIVADSGQWHAFSELCEKIFGYHVPLYHDDEEYYPDEPSMDAVRFLIWMVMSEAKEADCIYPDAPQIEQSGRRAFNILSMAFEEAPINEQLASDVQKLLDEATQGFNELRGTMTWVFEHGYLTSGQRNTDLINLNLEDAISAFKDEEGPEMSFGLASYYAITLCLFKYRIGPLALFVKDYLAAMMRVKGMEREADDVAAMEMLPMGHYKIDHVDASEYDDPSQKRLKLTRTNGREIEVKAEDLAFSEGDLEDIDGALASSFVFYQNEWHLNGVLFPFPGFKEHWQELCDDDPENDKPGTTSLTPEMLLKRTGGRQIAYFVDKADLKSFLNKTIGIPDRLLGFVDKRESGMSTFFINTTKPRNNVEFLFSYTSCIADPDNPFYDQETAQEEAFDMVWDYNNISTDMVTFLLDRGFLPDVFNDRMVPQTDTDDQKSKDIDFLLRFYRRENY